MTGFLAGVPVLVAILVAALLPFSILPAGLAQAFQEGGWGMRPILFALLVSIWLIVDRILMVLRSGIKAQELVDEIRPRLESGDVGGALELCKRRDRPLSRILAAGLSKASEGPRGVLAAMDESAYSEVPQIETRTGYLALMGNVATLMGLFGTIIGLIHSFGAVSMSSAADNATLLAAGISEAMNCTAFGLISGILALLAYSALNGRTQALIDELNHQSLVVFRLWKRGAQANGLAVAFERKPLAKPHPHLMNNVGLLHAKGHGAGGRKSTFASLQLTPLIDMFIVLVIFLLLNFSATGDIVSANKDIKLPFATKATELIRVPVVTISNMPDHPSGGIIALEGREVATVNELMEEVGADWKIPKLAAQLENSRNSWISTHPGQPFKGEIIVQCDQNIDFKVIKRVMYSVGLARYGNLMLAVQKRAEEG